jgi:hypothetical protein
MEPQSMWLEYLPAAYRTGSVAPEAKVKIIGGNAARAYKL